MRVHGELEIAGAPAAIEHALGEIEQSLTNGWSRSTELERRARMDGRCFVCTESGQRRAASLWLVPRHSRNEWWVSNIVPGDAGSLTFDEYNDILQEFHDLFVRPVADRLQVVTVRRGKMDEDLQDWMTPDAANLLRDFSRSANRSTGSSHPMDRDRWFAFLTRVHRDRRGPDATTLERWLVEHENWSETVASEIAIEYEFATALLRYYDAAR